MQMRSKLPVVLMKHANGFQSAQTLIPMKRRML
jgi:hypothetical protein